MELENNNVETMMDNVAYLEEDSLSDIAASDEDLDSVGEFCFETPRLSYKADNAYKNMLQSLVVKKAIQSQLKKEKNALTSFQKRALTSPLKFVEELSENKIQFPSLRKIPASTLADLSRINSKDDEAEEDEEDENKKNSSSPSKHNQVWTEEEQKKLEALLLRYPPEPVETRRWEKISFALGTRTPRQVASRVQKHFIKLMREGNPIPGRTPSKSYLCNNKKRSAQAALEDISDEEDIDPSLRHTTAYEEMLMVKKILAEKKGKLQD